MIYLTPSFEQALKVRLDFMVFCGLDIHEPVPDEDDSIVVFGAVWLRVVFMMTCWRRSAVR